jgi:sec-independent protein translocase protein TatB
VVDCREAAVADPTEVVAVFESVGWAEVLVLVVAGLFILGPERLPSAAAWLGRSVRQVKEYATGAREQLRSELGPEFDELRKPLEDLRGVRNFNARSAITNHLFDGENPLDGISGNGSGRSNSPQSQQAQQAQQAQQSPQQRPRSVSSPLEPGERPPYDPDAT